MTHISPQPEGLTRNTRQELLQLRNDLQTLLESITMSGREVPADLLECCALLFELDRIPTDDAEFLEKMRSSLGLTGPWNINTHVQPLRKAVWSCMLAFAKDAPHWESVLADRLRYARTNLAIAESRMAA